MGNGFRLLAVCGHVSRLDLSPGRFGKTEEVSVSILFHCQRRNDRAGIM